VGNREVKDPVSVGGGPEGVACPPAATKAARFVPRAGSPAAKRGGGKGGKGGGTGGKAAGKDGKAAGKGGKAASTGKGGNGRRRGRFALRRGRRGPAARVPSLAATYGESKG